MGNVLDLSVSGRMVFAVVYLGVQAVLIATGSMRPDRVFGFQMFNESSRMVITLSRRVNVAGSAPHGPQQIGSATEVVATDGTWEARDREGRTRRFTWRDRVNDPMVGVLGRSVRAAYGMAAQLDHLQEALDDVAQHLEGDEETRSLVADVRFERNGRAPVVTRLESAARK